MSAPWWKRAGCKGIDIDTEIPDCTDCPVVRECLDDALALEGADTADLRFYMRGGKTPGERFELAVERGVAEATPSPLIGECVGCKCGLISSRGWMLTPRDIRAGWTEQGWRRAHSADKCTVCYRKNRKATDPEYAERWRQKRNELRKAQRAREKAKRLASAVSSVA